MTEDATGERSVEERLNAIEMILSVITDKARNIDELAGATDALASSTVALDETLRTVGEAVITSREAKAQAQTASDRADAASDRADESLAELARSEHRYRRHTRRLALASLVISVLVSLLAAGGVLYLVEHDAHRFSAFLNSVQAQCTKRIGYDESNHEAVGGGVKYLKSQVAEQKRNAAATQALIATFPPAQRAALERAVVRGQRDLKTYLDSERRAYKHGVITSCATTK